MTTKTEVQANITAEELTSAVCENRLVAIVRMGKGETDFIELRCIGKDSYYLRNIIGRGYSYAKECFPVRGGNFDKAWHVVEVIARQVGADVDALNKLQNMQKSTLSNQNKTGRSHGPLSFYLLNTPHWRFYR